jgi:hypothetical protein
MYRVELWRRSPPVLLVAFHVASEQAPPTWLLRDSSLPAHWPEGYEWRRIPLPGSVVPAATWPADWRVGLRGYDQPQGFLVAPPGEHEHETAIWMD